MKKLLSIALLLCCTMSYADDETGASASDYTWDADHIEETRIQYTISGSTLTTCECVIVYTTSGKKVCVCNGSVRLKRGIYILKTQTKTQKIVIR